MNYDLGYMPHPEGNYNNSSPYTPMSIVYNNGKSYISKVAVQGVEPGVTSGWSNYWQDFADGVQGTQGATGAGTQGAVGSQGATGATGAGTQGATGSTGPTGPRGAGWFISANNVFSDGQSINVSDTTNPFAQKFIVGDIVMDRDRKVFTVIRVDSNGGKLGFLFNL